MNYKKAAEIILNYAQPSMNLGLQRIEKLNNLLGSLDLKTKFVHVAGTNGKGSTSTMIANILTEAGYKTGLFTSPCIKNFNERFKIDGKDISDEELLRISKKIKPFVKFMDEAPTEFELITAISIEYFTKNKCDIVVFEVGLGGKLDSTNVISKKEVAVITHIGFDHEAILGSTLEIIAREKAGIINPGCDVVVYSQKSSVQKIIHKTCSNFGIIPRDVNFENIETIKTDLNGQYFNIPEFPNLFLPILGSQQQKNACVAIETIKTLKKRGFKISKENIYSGLKDIKIHSRFEVINREPTVILDGAHNPQAFEILCENLKQFFKQKIVFVIGVLKDKNYKDMMKIIKPVAKKIYAVTPNCERALDSKKLFKFLQTLEIPAIDCKNINKGVKQAITESDRSDVICVTGSFYLGETL